jgi:hypothetical protein
MAYDFVAVAIMDILSILLPDESSANALYRLPGKVT